MMRTRLKPAMLLPLAIAALLTAPAASASTPDQRLDSDAQPAAVAERVFVQLKIETGGKTLKHPGHKMETGEELVLVLTQGKTKHETVIYVESADDGFSVEVTYSAGGKQKLKATKAAKDGWVTFQSDDKKSKVSVKVSAGNKRAKDLDMPDGDDPLDGV